MLGETYTVKYIDIRYEGIIPCVRETWHRASRLHNNRGPAVTWIADISHHGTFIKKEWFTNGVMHREEDRPAIEIETEWTTQEHWYFNGALHRDGEKPAIIVKNKETGEHIEEQRYVHGHLHAVRHPAVISTDIYSRIRLREIWMRKGTIERPHTQEALPSVTLRHNVSGVAFFQGFGSGDWRLWNANQTRFLDPLSGKRLARQEIDPRDIEFDMHSRLDYYLDVIIMVSACLLLGMNNIFS